MLESFSQEIRESRIRDWLLGVPRDTIAQSAGVAESTVTNIVEFYKQNENSIDLQRQIAVVIARRVPTSTSSLQTYVGKTLLAGRVVQTTSLHDLSQPCKKNVPSMA